MSAFPAPCPACEDPVLPHDAFCEGCSTRLESLPCPACGARASSADGYCERCGLRQSRARDHVEIEAGDAAAVSDRGLRHSRNEDAMALISWTVHTVAVVCDGVSISPRADHASATAARMGAASIVEGLRAGGDPEEATRAASARAAAAVAELASSVHDAPACTYVSAVVGSDRVTVGWVGDSRAYWLPDDGPAIVLTQDDVTSPGVLSAWLGADADKVAARTCDFAPPASGVLLICSDGLWGYLPDPRSLRAALSSGACLDRARGLVRHALDAGGRDNITVVLIPVAAPGRGSRQTRIGSPTSPLHQPNRRLT